MNPARCYPEDSIDYMITSPDRYTCTKAAYRPYLEGVAPVHDTLHHWPQDTEVL